MSEKIVVGYTNWRDRPEPYNYSKAREPGMVTYFQNHSPGAWFFDLQIRASFAEIYGQEALNRLNATMFVPENADAVCVAGTTANTEEKAAALKTVGKIWGHDPIYAVEDHSGMVEIDTPMGKKWVPISSIKFADLPVSDAIAMIREAVRQAIAAGK